MSAVTLTVTENATVIAPVTVVTMNTFGHDFVRPTVTVTVTGTMTVTKSVTVTRTGGVTMTL